MTTVTLAWVRRSGVCGYCAHEVDAYWTWVCSIVCNDCFSQVVRPLLSKLGITTRTHVGRIVDQEVRRYEKDNPLPASRLVRNEWTNYEE